MFIRTVLMGTFLLATAATAAAQQCVNDAASNLLACAHVSLESCRLGNGCEADRRQALTVQDIVEDAAARCCHRPARKQRRCLVREARALNRTRARAPRSVRPFLREARIGVQALRVNGCSTGSLGAL